MSSKVRIQIVNWRNHGDDESYVSMGVYSHGDDTDVLVETRTKLELVTDPDWEAKEDYENGYYTNDDITIENGQVLEHNGKKFRVTIREVKERAPEPPAPAAAVDVDDIMNDFNYPGSRWHY